MKIQPITMYRSNNVYTNRNVRRVDEPVSQPINQPSFKGFKGLLKGIAVGAGVTAAGVAMIAGAAALPLFASYIAVNGAIAGATGHLIESQNKDESKK